ncbi:MAG: response regulator [Candidatus Omnitrophica bacterium]|nr:response regulator [Candidatus Omnitrophota bacterium]
MKILLVDDEQSVLNMVGSFFKGMGQEVQTATDIKSAIAQIEAFKPILILLDLKLGEENGLEVLQYVKTHHKEIKVIVITGFNEKDTEEKIKSLGADAFTTKPIMVSTLNKLIKELMK